MDELSISLDSESMWMIECWEEEDDERVGNRFQ